MMSDAEKFSDFCECRGGSCSCDGTRKLSENSGDELILEFQKDEAGMKGDVRDIVAKRPKIGWEVGFSIKHNHDAVKHSRLSYKLDFGEEWFQIPCSSQYWKCGGSHFTMLKEEKKIRQMV